MSRRCTGGNKNMRTIYKIVLGLLLFNGFLALFSPIFNEAVSTSAIDEGAINITDTNMTKYELKKPTDIMGIIFTGGMGVWAGAAVAVVALGFALVTKNYIFIGVGLFVSIIVGLYVNMSVVLTTVGNVADNIYVSGIITLVGIAIGLLVVFSVIDMFAPGAARE